MKKMMIVLVMLVMTAGASAELVQNYDFTGADETPWSHSGYVPWSGGSWIDLANDYFRGTGWGSTSWTNNAVWQDTGATFAANTVYIMTAEWRDGSDVLERVQLVIFDATTSTDVKKATTGAPASGWGIDTLIVDTASYPSIVGHNIGVAVRNASSVGAWMDVNYISLIVAGAYTPVPDDGTTVDTIVTSQLSWTYPPLPVGTQTSKVYLGTPNISSATLLSDADDTDNVVDVSLSPNTAYEWRVDVVDSGAGNITGDVWSFTTAAAPVDNDITIDPDVTHQTFEGFGVGTMDQFIPYWYTVWTTAKMDEYLDKMYTLDNDGLGLEITRVPMAVGDDPTHNHMWAYNQPGMGLRSPEAFEPEDGVFDWTGHEEFLWHIQGAEARGVKMWAYWHGVPHWMSVSGCSAGSTNGWSNNLPYGSEARFAEHMCDVLEHFKNSWGVDFDYVGAINEPDENWWDCWNETDDIWAGNQPGCHVSSDQAVTIHQELKSEMDLRGLTTKMVGPDSYSMDAADDIAYLDTLLNSSVGPDIDVYSAHQYSVSDYSFSQWYWRSNKNNKSFWMSEWGDWENGGYPDNDPLAQAENYANKIQQGLKDIKVTAYIFWESALMIDTTTSSFSPRKAYWVSAQFSRFIRSGMQSIQAYDSDANSKTTVWIDPVVNPDGQKLVMVTVNDGSTAIIANYDLSQFRGAKINEVRRTSPTEDYVNVPITQSSDFDYSVYAPAKSVITVSATIQSCKNMSGDLTEDCIVDMDDLLVVAGNWTYSEAYPCSPVAGDTDDDCTVDNIDYANVGTDWLGIEAFNPDPANGQSDVDTTGTLSWGDNYYAISYDVYIGTNQSNVQNATDVSSEYQGNTTETSYLYDLSTSQTYYCRVDSEDSLGAFQKGDVWSFTTSSVAADSDLVGWWKLDESSGWAQDSSSAGNTSYFVGNPQWKPTLGKINGAVDLDGNGDYFYVPDLELASNTVTITAWINGWKSGDWAGIIYSRSSASAVATGMHFGGDSKLHYSWNYNDSTTWNWSGGPTIPQNQWALVAMVIEPDKATLYVYSDGSGLQSAVNSMPHVPQMIDNLKFGYDDMDSARIFNGLVDDVRIYKRALTSQEILDLVP